MNVFSLTEHAYESSEYISEVGWALKDVVHRKAS